MLLWGNSSRGREEDRFHWQVAEADLPWVSDERLGVVASCYSKCSGLGRGKFHSRWVLQLPRGI
eukprot:1595861-Lingulodinium_polyedra.AAC.1